MELAEELKGTGVFIKINSFSRAMGYPIVHKLHNLGLKVFDDLKIIDISETMITDAQMLLACRPEIVTIMCCSGITAMYNVQQILGDVTEILGVTVLTSLTDPDCEAVFGCSVEAGVLRFARMAQLAHLCFINHITRRY